MDEIKKTVREQSGKIVAARRAGAVTASELEETQTQPRLVQIRIQPNEKSQTFIRDWVPGSRLEECVVSASIKAVRP